MTDYKCEKHKLTFACFGCIRAWIKRNERMKSFIKYISRGVHDGSCLDLSCQAEELLKEIGEY